MCLVGLGVSLYLSAAHVARGAIPLACSTSGVVNCEQVTTSPESTIGPVPVAFLGVVWFLVALGLTLVTGRLPGDADLGQEQVSVEPIRSARGSVTTFPSPLFEDVVQGERRSGQSGLHAHRVSMLSPVPRAHRITFERGPAVGQVSPAGIAIARVAWSLGGLLVVCYLIYAELFLIGAICLWCTVVHVLVVALFLLALDNVVGLAEANEGETPA